MCKALIVAELSKVFECSEDKVWPAIKKALLYLGGYCLLMLLTFILAGDFIANGFFKFGAIVYFSFMIELSILSIAISFLILLTFVYYGALFAHKGWKRYQAK